MRELQVPECNIKSRCISNAPSEKPCGSTGWTQVHQYTGFDPKKCLWPSMHNIKLSLPLPLGRISLGGCQKLKEAGLTVKPRSASWGWHSECTKDTLWGEDELKWKQPSSKQPRSSVSRGQRRRSARSYWVLPEVYIQLLISGKPTCL